MAAITSITGVTFQDQDYLDTPGTYLDGTLMSKYAAVLTVKFSKSQLNKRLIFDSGAKTITNGNTLDTDSFIVNGQWKVGQNIIIPLSASNNGVLTITAITDTVITVSQALVNETLGSGNIYLHDKITALDLFYNLISNASPESYISKTDAGVLQRYYATGLDTTVATPVSMLIGTGSYAWVTDTLTGNVSQATISGANASFGTGSNYDQVFTITHYFFQAPYFIRAYFPYFQSKTSPPDYTGNGSTPTEPNALKYIASVSCKLAAGPTVEATGNWLGDGTSAWLNQNSLRTPPDFTLTSIAYKDDATSNSLAAIDFSKTNDVTIIINSASGAFTGSTKVVVNHLYCPINESDYQNTSTTLRQNFMHDRVAMVVGAGAANGEFFGGNYSIIQAATAVKNSANQITITFKAIYATALQTYLKARANNRNFGFIVTVQ